MYPSNTQASVALSTIHDKWILFSFSGHKNIRICIGLAQACVNVIESGINERSSSKYKSCDCLPDCNEIKYSYELQVNKFSTGKLPNITDNAEFALESEVLITLVNDECSVVCTFIVQISRKKLINNFSSGSTCF